MDFWNEIVVHESDSDVEFYHKESYDSDYGGGLFYIMARIPEDVEQLPDDMYPTLGEHRGLAYRLDRPRDVQYAPETQEAYFFLYDQIDEILQTFRFGVG